MAYERMAEGSYWARVLSGKCVEIGAKKTPCLAVEFEVTHGTMGDDWQSLPRPAKRTVKMFLSDAAWPYSEKKLAKLGFNGDFVYPAFDVENQEGFELICCHDTRDDKTYEKWELAEFQSGSDDVAPPENTLRRLSARWKTGQAASTKPKGRPNSPPTAPVPKPDFPPGEEPPWEEPPI